MADVICVHGCEGEITERRILRDQGQVTVACWLFFQCIQMPDSKWARKERREGTWERTDRMRG